MAHFSKKKLRKDKNKVKVGEFSLLLSFKWLNIREIQH
jgi:hypothetical protein